MKFEIGNEKQLHHQFKLFDENINFISWKNLFANNNDSNTSMILLMTLSTTLSFH